MKPRTVEILLFVVAVLLTLQIKSCFNKDLPESYYKQKIADKENEIKQIVTERDFYRKRADSVISSEKRKDTLLIREYKTNVTKYEKVPVYINGLSSDSLLQSAIDF